MGSAHIILAAGEGEMIIDTTQTRTEHNMGKVLHGKIEYRKRGGFLYEVHLLTNDQKEKIITEMLKTYVSRRRNDDESS